MSDTKYNDPSCLDVIELDTIPEPIRRRFYEADIPAITYRGNDLMYVNTKATSLFSFDYVSISTTPEYVVLRPANTSSATAFRVSTLKSGKGKMIRIPVDLKEKKIKKGMHRLYKYKDGYCFKRNEVLWDGGEA